ncbi:hypothetical protein D9613_006433 [Agrocybe pediades]|uniref:Uncharacterized protein n=1 Tax=Agrocybe pediades TaxID=84607 RepID=A0A8H4QUX2_9AGAR|nr:hypothetical protein D9613_006433 [Agrocybe pediades]
MQQANAVDTARNELKDAVTKVLPMIGNTQGNETLKALVQKLSALLQVLAESKSDKELAANFRAWDTPFEVWAQAHASLVSGLREGHNSEVWEAFFAKKDALDTAIQHLT